MYNNRFLQLYLTCAISTRMAHAYFPVKVRKYQIQDRVKSRSRPWNKWLSSKILERWSP